MAQTKRSQLGNRTSRLTLTVATDHNDTLAPGCYIVYRRPTRGGGGTWRARWRDPETKKFSPAKLLGTADDYCDADGQAILTFGQASEAAGKWFDTCRKESNRLASGEEVRDGEFTVANALRDYLSWRNTEGKTDQTNDQIGRVHVLPTLGDLPVSKLTKKRLQDWFFALAEAPTRIRGQHFSEEGSWGDEPPTEEQLRPRKNTANRIFAVLRAALNHAVAEGTVADDHTPWRLIRPFRGVAVSRDRFLSLKQQQALVRACPPDFEKLVRAALYTGSRYAPLCALRVRDLNPRSKTLFIARDKGGKSRHIALTDEAFDWFHRQAKDKDADNLFFERTSVQRTIRKDIGNAWAPDDQAPMMRAACEAAKIEFLTFHELRHTYASNLVNAGVPLAFVAAQLGHADTRMVEKHYGHLAQTALSESIRRLAPKLDLDKPARKKKTP